MEMTASYPSKLLFSWFDGVMYRGWRRPLEPSDMHNLQPGDSARTISQVWRHSWHQEAKRNKRDGIKV